MQLDEFAACAGMQFDAVEGARELPKAERVAISYGFCDRLRLPLAIAMEILAQTKDELVAGVYSDGLEALDDAVSDAKVACELIEAARLRYAFALSERNRAEGLRT